MDKAELIERIAELSDDAEAGGEIGAALVLLTLAAAMRYGREEALIYLVAPLGVQMSGKVEELQTSL